MIIKKNYLECLGNNDNDRINYWESYDYNCAGRYRPYKLIVWQGEEILKKQEYRVIPLHDIYFLARGHDYNADTKKTTRWRKSYNTGKKHNYRKTRFGGDKKANKIWNRRVIREVMNEEGLLLKTYRKLSRSAKIGDGDSDGKYVEKTKCWKAHTKNKKQYLKHATRVPKKHEVTEIEEDDWASYYVEDWN